jgi:hypothetical protein
VAEEPFLVSASKVAQWPFHFGDCVEEEATGLLPLRPFADEQGARRPVHQIPGQVDRSVVAASQVL